MVLGDGEGVLQESGGFDQGGYEAGCDVPFDVAVEEPDAWREKWGVSWVCFKERMKDWGGETYQDCRLGSAGRCFPLAAP